MVHITLWCLRLSEQGTLNYSAHHLLGRIWCTEPQCTLPEGTLVNQCMVHLSIVHTALQCFDKSEYEANKQELLKGTPVSKKIKDQKKKGCTRSSQSRGHRTVGRTTYPMQHTEKDAQYAVRPFKG